MRNATYEFQNIVLFGGTSDIGLAIVAELVTQCTRNVVLACRDTYAGDAVATDFSRPHGCEIHVVKWDATELEGHVECVGTIAKLVGDLDVVVMAAGTLGSQMQYDDNPADIGNAVITNMAGPMTTIAASARHMREQGHGQIVVLSSIAGVRVRSTNHVYGSTKAGLDAYAQGLSDHLHRSGVHTTIVRPGFVVGRMTNGMKPMPFPTTPKEVATDTVHGIHMKKRVVYTPKPLTYLGLLIKHIPNGIWRRISIRP